MARTKAKKKDAEKSNGEALEIQGAQVRALALKATGGVELNGAGALPGYHETFAFVGRARLEGFGISDIKDVPTLVGKSKIRHATVIDEATAEDFFDQQREQSTGQLQLLSFEGEHRRAGRLAAEARQAQVDERAGEDDEDTWTPGDFCDLALEDIAVVRAAWAKGEAEGVTVPEVMADVEKSFAAVAAWALGGIEWARRRAYEHNEAQRAEIEREAIETARKTAEAAAVHSNEEQDKAERRGIAEDDDGEVSAE